MTRLRLRFRPAGFQCQWDVPHPSTRSASLTTQKLARVLTEKSKAAPVIPSEKGRGDLASLPPHPGRLSPLQVLMVRFASLFNVKDQTVMFLSRTTYSLQELGAMGMGDLLNAMFDFSEKLNSLALTEEELGLFTAVVLVSAGRSGSRLSLTGEEADAVRFNTPFMEYLLYARPCTGHWRYRHDSDTV